MHISDKNVFCLLAKIRIFCWVYVQEQLQVKNSVSEKAHFVSEHETSPPRTTSLKQDTNNFPESIDM